MKVEEKALDMFGELLMRRVRDEAISDWDMILDGRMKSPRAQLVRERLAALDPRAIEIFRSLVPQIVDSTLHHLLWTLEQEEWLKVAVQTDAGLTPNLREASDGLAGELYSTDGWIARFSKERTEGTSR